MKEIDYLLGQLHKDKLAHNNLESKIKKLKLEKDYEVIALVGMVDRDSPAYIAVCTLFFSHSQSFPYIEYELYNQSNPFYSLIYFTKGRAHIICSSNSNFIYLHIY